MSPERKASTAPVEYEKLGKPDFVGKWCEKINPDVFENTTLTQEFRMYLIKRGTVGKGVEVIEGVIIDDYGLAIFSGTLKKDSIKFTKIYSPEAKREGGASRKIYYKGKFEEIRKAYMGTFDCFPKGKGGKFCLYNFQ